MVDRRKQEVLGVRDAAVTPQNSLICLRSFIQVPDHAGLYRSSAAGRERHKAAPHSGPMIGASALHAIIYPDVLNCLAVGRVVRLLPERNSAHDVTKHPSNTDS